MPSARISRIWNKKHFRYWRNYFTTAYHYYYYYINILWIQGGSQYTNSTIKPKIIKTIHTREERGREGNTEPQRDKTCFRVDTRPANAC